MRLSAKFTAALLAFVMILSLLAGCNFPLSGDGGEGGEPPVITSLRIDGKQTRELTVGAICVLEINHPESVLSHVVWTVDGDAVTVDGYGVVVAVKQGTATVKASYGFLSDTVIFNVGGGSENDGGPPDIGDGTGNGAGGSGGTGNGAGGELTSDPYVGMSKTEFYANYTPAQSFEDAYYRTQHGFLSGKLEIPSAAPKADSNQPMSGGSFVRNTDMRYEDGGNTYVVYDSHGGVAFKIYRGGAYITLEEVAAYMFAFGGKDGAFPANYTSSKSTRPQSSIWEEHLRVNHSYFSGDTEKYPREPELPNIMGCGGALQYWEMDIGTASYNNGNKITRGACRIVYGRNDLDRDGVYEKEELHVFYTYNHYDDFQEYLNYEGGWGEIFGYETNGSSSSKGPSPYVPVVYGSFTDRAAVIEYAVIIIPQDKRYYISA